MALVHVSGAQGAREVDGSLGGLPLVFFPYGEGWAAVAGIDLETRAGRSSPGAWAWSGRTAPRAR